MAPRLKIGVLALQGAFAKHIEMLRKLAVEPIEVRKPEELARCDGLIIPGGESTTILRQIRFIELTLDLQQFASQKPVFGTCAGLILMARKIVADPMEPFGFLDIEVERNAYGKQADSFQVPLDLKLTPKSVKGFKAVFIRAPRIKAVTTKVEIMGSHEGEAVMVRQGFHLGSTFHPELTDNPAVHDYFASIVKTQLANQCCQLK